MSHTPGKWVVETDSIPIGAQGKRTPTMVMVVAELGGMPGLIVNQGPVEPRDFANARLIAAAPDLLEALRGLLLATQEMADSYAIRTKPFDSAAHLIENDYITACGIANEAIRKAEGK